MRTYLASAYYNRGFMQIVEEFLDYALPRNVRVNMEIVGDWWNQPAIPNNNDRAAIDYGAIDACDLLIAFYPHGEGTTSEMGFALGQGKNIIYYIPQELVDEVPLPAGHRNCYVAHTLEHLLSAIKGQYDRLNCA